MYPELIKIGDFVISSFGFMMVVAFLTTNYLLRKDLKSIGSDPNLADDLTFRAALGGILGAKIYYLIENIPNGGASGNLSGLYDIFAGIFTLNGSLIAGGIQNFGAGMVFLGGFIGGLISVTLFIRKHNLKWFVVADWVAPLLVLGHGIGRIGCFLVGDDYGKPSELPWAISFPNGLPISSAGNLRSMGCTISNDVLNSEIISVHPTQLYEMFLYFAIFLALRFRKKYQEFHGQLFFEYLFLAGFARFMVEFIRLNPRYILGLSGAQIISGVMMCIGTYFMWKLRKKHV